MHAPHRAVWLGSLLSLAVAFQAAAQSSIQFLIIEENHRFVQTDATTTAVAPDTTNPWSIRISLDGTNLSAFTGTLAFTSPSGSAVASGAAAYDSSQDRYWFYREFATQVELDTAFAGGIYDVSFNGTHLPLSLSGDLYPAAGLITITGTTGVWNNGTYIIPPGHDVTISSAFSDLARFGTGNTHFSIGVNGDGTSYSNSLDLFGSSGSVTIPAADLVLGQSYNVWVDLAGIMDMSSALSPITSAAIYSTDTEFTLMVAVPEPGTVALCMGGIMLGFAGYCRLRTRRMD